MFSFLKIIFTEKYLHIPTFFEQVFMLTLTILTVTNETETKYETAEIQSEFTINTLC